MSSVFYLGCNYIFLEVEKDGCEFVFERILSEFEGKVLLKPDQDQVKMFRYARRRNKEKELREFLQSKTNVELKVG